MMSDELCAGQDVLSERIIQIFVFVRNVQRMAGQMTQGNDLVSAFQQQSSGIPMFRMGSETP